MPINSSLNHSILNWASKFFLPFIISFEKCLFRSSAHFWIGLFGLLLLSWVPHRFTNNFFHSPGCLFTLLIVSFSLQKLFSLMQSHLFDFAFVARAFDVICKKSSPKPVSRSFFPCFLLVVWFQVLLSLFLYMVWGKGPISSSIYWSDCLFPTECLMSLSKIRWP